MKRFIAFLLIVLVTPLYGAMSDSQALKQVKTLFGVIGYLGYGRNMIQANWTRNIGVQSLGCKEEFTILGKGLNSWDAAFQYYTDHPVSIKGPIKGTVDFTAKAVDDFTVVKMDYTIDSKPLNAVIPNTPAPQWFISVPINTTLLSQGLHVVCTTATDQSGNVGGSEALLFTVDQSIAMGPGSLQANPVDLRPSASKPTLSGN